MPDDAQLELVLPWPPPPEAEAVVVERLGVVADIKGPRRGIEIDTIMLFMSGAFAAGLFEKLGSTAGEAMLDVLQWLRRAGAPVEREQQDREQQERRTPTDLQAESTEPAGAHVWDTEIVIDDTVTVRVRTRPPADPRPLQAVLTGAFDSTGSVMLIWDPERQELVGAPPPGDDGPDQTRS